MTTDIFLVTFNLLPQGEDGSEQFTNELAARGLTWRWVIWDDPDVDWTSAKLIVQVSAWDYHRRLEGFLSWIRGLDQSRLFRDADTFSWNVDKIYLLDLEKRGVPIVPTKTLTDDRLVQGLQEVFTDNDGWGDTVVVKPRVSLDGIGVILASTPYDHRLACLAPGPWLVQPLCRSIKTVGEVGVFVFDGVAVSQVRKRTGNSGDGDEIRIHGVHGGSSAGEPVGEEERAVAELAYRVGSEVVGKPLVYARADLMLWEGKWCVSELEAIDPSLYSASVPKNPELFADSLAKHLRRMEDSKTT